VITFAPVPGLRSPVPGPTSPGQMAQPSNCHIEPNLRAGKQSWSSALFAPLLTATLRLCPPPGRTVNCIDRHLAERGNENALVWEKDEPGQTEYITYNKLHEEVCRLANVLKENGVKKVRGPQARPSLAPRCVGLAAD